MGHSLCSHPQLPIPSRTVLRGVTYTPAISHLFSLVRFESEPSERPSSPDSHETVVAKWRARVTACPPSSDPSLLPSSTSIPSTLIDVISIIPALSTKFTATPHVLSTTPVHATFNHRFRDLVFYYEASVEDGMEADSEIGSEAGVGFNVEDEAYTEDYDTYIRTYIIADAEAHA
ncbi:hypothetical protein Tco_0735020 [Tanacetum coccineum]